MLIPQQEIPGTVPSAYVMRHPNTGAVEVSSGSVCTVYKLTVHIFVHVQLWWSPCPSRECPEEEEIDIVVDQCLDHCILFEQNPKIEIIKPPTDAPKVVTEDNGEIDDLNFHLSKRKKKEGQNGKNPDTYSSTATSDYTYGDDEQSTTFFSSTVEYSATTKRPKMSPDVTTNEYSTESKSYYIF